MGWQDDFSNFDLGRLTLAGWLMFLLSIAAGIAAGVYVAVLTGELNQSGNAPSGRRKSLTGIAGFAGAIGFFFAGKALLKLGGITMVRPPKN